MNSLPLSRHLFYLTRFLLLTNPALHCSAKLVPRPFRAQQKFFFGLYKISSKPKKNFAERGKA